MNLIRQSLVLSATLLLAAPCLIAQQPGGSSDQMPGPSHGDRPAGHEGMHRPSTQTVDQDEERQTERQDLDELGMPLGDFWQDQRLVRHISLTPEEIRQLSEKNLQGRLKLIQLDANLEMEQAKLDAMLDGENVDSGAALAQTDRIAEARAAIEKADAHLAFDLRAVLTPAQLAILRNGRMQGRMRGGPGMPSPRRQGQSTPMKPATPPAPAQ